MRKKPQIGLSPRKRAILLAIADLLETKKWPPSFQEIGDAAGLPGSSVGYYVELLTKDGLILRALNARRHLEITETGSKFVRQLRKSAA